MIPSFFEAKPRFLKPRCMGIYLLGYCGKCIKNKQEEKKQESIGNKFQPQDG